MDKPRLDQGPDYERGFIDGMMYQTQTTVNKAVAEMAVRTHTPEDVQKIMKPWVKLTNADYEKIKKDVDIHDWPYAVALRLEKLNT